VLDACRSFPGDRFAGGPMRAETAHVAQEIEQALALLRRHL
jgi:hypothetical protein